jgi:mannose-6-phosphate isomerase-like protein (cupin superfamily)
LANRQQRVSVRPTADDPRSIRESAIIKSHPKTFIKNRGCMDKINLEQKFALFNDQWSPKIVGEVGDQYIKLAKVKGEFVWHQHDNEDELFWVVKGKLTIKMRDGDVVLTDGEIFVVPKGVEHCPVAEEETQIVLFEPKATTHTGDVQTDLTVPIEKQHWI